MLSKKCISGDSNRSNKDISWPEYNGASPILKLVRGSLEIIYNFQIIRKVLISLSEPINPESTCEVT